METIEFWKMNGSGNDFILIDNRDKKVAEEEMEGLVKGACRRRESVGADGLIFIEPSEKHDFSWRFFNADGGEVEMCGNGGRCVARFAYLKGISGSEMTFKTLVGPVSANVDGRIVKVLMPQPSDYRKDIDLSLQNENEHIDFINTGVPHVVVHVKEIETFPVFDVGRSIRYHAKFEPHGTNANFIKVNNPGSIDIRTYERGVEDETLACGTGSIAAALVASERGMVKSPVSVMTRGGEVLTIHFDREGDSFNQVWLEGSTSIVYQGTLHREAI